MVCSRAVPLLAMLCTVLGDPLAYSPGDCQRLLAAKTQKLPPWSHAPLSPLLVDRDLSSLARVHYLDYARNPQGPSVKPHAERAFDHFIESSNLGAELEEVEQEVYKERFVMRMRVNFECSFSAASWQDTIAQALEQEKPRLTKALTQHLLEFDTGEARQRDRSSPPNVERALTTYDWCDCRTGLDSIAFWSDEDPGDLLIVTASSVRWLSAKSRATKINWICSGMAESGDSKDATSMLWSLQLYPLVKPGFLAACNSLSGRIRANTWRATDYISSVPFTSDSEGYACMKIPALLRTQKGSLIAFAEARTPNCSDFAKTDLVYKRSIDGGRTWSALDLVVKPSSNKGVCDASLVVGNAAPVQLAVGSKYYPGRILLPHTLNNFAFWITYSDDDGITWSSPAEIPNVTHADASPDCKRGMPYYGYDVDYLNIHSLGDFLIFADMIGWGKASPYDDPGWRAKMRGPWQFMGLGPGGSLQLSSGRVLVPGYHSWMRGLSGGNGSPGQLPVSQLYNNLAFGHILVSDDGGDTWRLRSPNGFHGGSGQGANEDQMVQLSNGSVLVNSRSFATGTPQFRVQARSDDEGETFTPTRFVHDLPEPFNGCQGSFVRGAGDSLYISHPDPSQGIGILPELAKTLGARVNLTGRDHMTIFKSTDGGATYPVKYAVDPGLTGYSSLQYSEGKLGLLYEQADPDPFKPSQAITGSLNVEVPTRFVFREILESEIPEQPPDRSFQIWYA